jgi:hypothetical protein
MPNFAWTMADFALQFPGHIMGLFMLALLCLSIMVIGPVTFPDVVNGLPGGGNTALSRGISLLSSCTNEGWLTGNWELG